MSAMLSVPLPILDANLLEIANPLEPNPVNQPPASPLKTSRVVLIIRQIDDDILDHPGRPNATLDLLVLDVVPTALNVLRVQQTHELVEKALTDALHVIVLVDVHLGFDGEAIHAEHVVEVVRKCEADDCVGRHQGLSLAVFASSFEDLATLAGDDEWELVLEDCIEASLHLLDSAALHLGHID